MFQRNFLASDGSAHSLRATDKAIELARHMPEAQLEVLYVVDAAHTRHDVLNNLADSDSMDEMRHQRLIQTEEKIKAAEIPYTVRVLHGEPGPTIVKYANENHAELPVMIVK